MAGLEDRLLRDLLWSVLVCLLGFRPCECITHSENGGELHSWKPPVLREQLWLCLWKYVSSPEGPQISCWCLRAAIPVGLARAQPSTRGPPCPGAVLPDRTLRLLQTAVGAEAWVSSPSASSCLLSRCCCSSFRTPLQLSTPRAPAETLGL